jgi:phosphoglycolate phosphatase-like HAD superfamily hydrolase
MDPRDRAQRVVALTAIKDKAEQLAEEGMDAVGVQTFIAGARGKLAQEKPDPEMYRKAVMAAKAAKGQEEF